jgi:hypothetical protein
MPAVAVVVSGADRESHPRCDAAIVIDRTSDCCGNLRYTHVVSSSASAVPFAEDPMDVLFRELAEAKVTSDPVHAWMVAHRDELVGLVGHRIALDPNRGIIASAPTIEGLVDEMERRNLLADHTLTVLTVS